MPATFRGERDRYSIGEQIKSRLARCGVSHVGRHRSERWEGRKEPMSKHQSQPEWREQVGWRIRDTQTCYIHQTLRVERGQEEITFSAEAGEF